MRESDERGAQLLATPFLLTLIVLLIGCENEGRPNIVLISVDTLRANHLTPYGYDRETTPFLASLAEESVLFTDAISQCGTTPQSLTSIMTGLYPFSDRVVGRRKGFVFLRRSNVTLARVLRDLGYDTHAITSSIQSSRATGINLGFESFDGIDVGVDQKMKRRKSGEVTGLAVEWLRSRARAEDPFFLWIHYLDPHYPYAAPPSYEQYFEKHHPAEEGEVRFYRFDAIHDKRHPLSDGELARINIQYDREVRYIDDELRALFENGLVDHLDQTLVVFTADHGESLGDHQIVNHNDLYQTILHVPLMVRLPGASNGGTRIDEPVMLVDLKPTILDILGVPSDTPLRGRSLRPWLVEDSPEEGAERFRVAEYADRRTVYRGDLKLITRDEGQEMYDIGRDRYETRNLVGQLPDVQKMLLAHAAQLEPAPHSRPREESEEGPEITPQILQELRALGYAPE